MADNGTTIIGVVVDKASQRFVCQVQSPPIVVLPGIAPADPGV